MQGDKLHQFLMPYATYRELQKIGNKERKSIAAIIREAISLFLMSKNLPTEKSTITG